MVTPNRDFAAALTNSGLTPSLDSRRLSQNVNSNDSDGNGGIGLTAVYGWDDYTLTSITALDEMDSYENVDVDNTPRPIVDVLAPKVSVAEAF